MKELCKAINSDWVNHQACSLSHNIHVVSDSFVTNDYIPKMIRQISSINNFLKFVHLVAIKYKFR